jgi:hypothetical protein
MYFIGLEIKAEINDARVCELMRTMMRSLGSHDFTHALGGPNLIMPATDLRFRKDGRFVECFE